MAQARAPYSEPRIHGGVTFATASGCVRDLREALEHAVVEVVAEREGGEQLGLEGDGERAGRIAVHLVGDDPKDVEEGRHRTQNRARTHGSSGSRVFQAEEVG